MKILMFGRGAIAVGYGWALERAGHEIEFFVRPGRAAEYGDTVDVDLLDARSGLPGIHIHETWSVRLRESLEPDHDFDLIVLSVGHHRLSEAAVFLAPRVGQATVLILGNIFVEPLQAIGDLPIDQLAWGFPGGGGGFDKSGGFHGALAPQGTMGKFGLSLSDREVETRQVLRDAGFRFKEQADLYGWLLLHFIADAGIHAQGLRLGTLSRLAGSRKDLREALLTTRELLPILKARGIDPHRAGTMLYRAPVWLTAPLLAAATKYVPLARRALEVHDDPDAPEQRVICRDALAEARRLGIPAPRLASAEALFAE